MTQTIDLNGTWRLRPDPGNVGLAEAWYETSWASDEAWRDVRVPGAWQQVLGTDFHSFAWYRRTLPVPENWTHTTTRIRFESVATEITLWINEQRVGTHVGDYVPIEFDISEHVQPGALIHIVARVDEMMGHITKGFHDMLSIHHGGIWQPVTLIGSGSFTAQTDGIGIVADLSSEHIRIDVDHSIARDGDFIRIKILDPAGLPVALSQEAASGNSTSVEFDVNMPIQPWPGALYTASVDLVDGHSSLRDEHTIRFGFRDLQIDGTTIRLNGQPVHLRGMLHWGHEPTHIAPAPTDDEIRDDMRWARDAGFNCICLCMWYPPRSFYDIADEEGMFIWQEHPVWHSPMDTELLPEYQRLYEAFFKRDRNHPSVLIVSATCEHPCFDPALASWWWTRAPEMLPNAALQVQTSSFAWSDPNQTDLYDEHTYDNNNRWVTYLEDLQDTLRRMPTTRPFVMGESIVFSSWPDLDAIAERIGDTRPWWLPSIYEHAVTLESEWRDEFGEETLTRFREQSVRHHLLGRQFQIERFRAYANHAGLVMNHLRDVPQCSCGFKDDLDQWRFDSADLRGWLGDAIVTLDTPDHRRSFVPGEIVDASLALSNFGPHDIDETVTLSVGEEETLVSIVCEQGEVEHAPVRLALPSVDTPTRVMVKTQSDSTPRNRWDLWVLPDSTDASEIHRLDGLPFQPEDSAPDEIEKGYSRGFGLPVKQWICRLPDPATLVPNAAPIRNDDIPGSSARTIVTHRLTTNVINALCDGVSVLLFASKAPGGLGTSYEWLFGQCPLVVERSPLCAGDSAWIVDLLGFDLTRTYARVIPVDGLGLTDAFDPIIRLVYTHDMRERVRFFDMMSMTRVGRGVLLVSSVDHHDPAGQFLLNRALTALRDQTCKPNRKLEASRLRPFAFDG